ncbi:MAG: flavin reductase family protein [Pigmentiphaga sp.]|nr:flavin reductase family protein [Pigmentiphaga sp.]
MDGKTSFDPSQADAAQLYKLLAGLVVPRPIALVSTINAQGVRNLAPFSWFSVAATDPPYLSVSIARRADGRRKDTLENLLQTRVFTVNLVGEEMAVQQDRCAQDFPAEADEFEVAGLTPVPGTRVPSFCVAESRAWFECELFQSLALPDSSYTLVIGKVLMIHVDERVLDQRLRIDPDRLNAIGRLAGRSYCRLNDRFMLDHDSFKQASRG